MKVFPVLLLSVLFLTISCQNEDEGYIATDQSILNAAFGTNIDLENITEYQNFNVPSYIRFSNTGNIIDNKKALLGRILFYDQQLSINNSISCASCHQQENAFGDTSTASIGVNGLTGRHSMRLINTGFQPGTNFFWDERVASLEEQVTQPIRDHTEMGFSGEQGSPSFDELLLKLSLIDYYQVLFNEVYGDALVTETRLQESLSQFVLSIQSFDSKYDAGLMATGDLGGIFPNYNTSENRGKFLFTTTPQNGGAGCVSCHVPPEFAIRDNIQNNGVIATMEDASVFDHTNTRSPSLRNITNPDGELNGPLMHNSSFTTIMEMIEHYNAIDLTNQQSIDPILLQNNGTAGQRLRLSVTDKTALVDFLKTLSGDDVYTNVKWSNPFLER